MSLAASSWLGGSPQCGTIARLIRVWAEPEVSGGGDEKLPGGHAERLGSGKLGVHTDTEVTICRFLKFEIEHRTNDTQPILESEAWNCNAPGGSQLLRERRMVTGEVLRRP